MGQTPIIFKLLGGASESHHPSAPSQLYLAIASIFSLSVCRVKEYLKPNRPYINVQIGPTLAATLYDSGADISCISEQQFRKIPIDQRPQKNFQKVDPCFSAGGAQLFVRGIVSLPISILGRKTVHTFRIISGLNESVILGADFINKHLLVYDPKIKQVNWRNKKSWTVSSIKMTNEVVVPKYSSRLVRIKAEDGMENTDQVIAEIMCAEMPYIVGGPRLIKVDAAGYSLMEIFNTGPEPVTLTRGQCIGQADNADGQALTPFKAEVVNSIAESQWKSSRKCQQVSRSEEFEKLCRLEVPVEYKEKYRALLAKHRDIFTVEKSDLGYCDTVLHKLFMKNQEPVYIKQFCIPEAHHSYLQDQVREWLKLGIIQPSRSRYNSPVFLVQKKDGSNLSSSRFQVAQC
jgi:hypothetical protein